jgi:hypothetical protein
MGIEPTSEAWEASKPVQAAANHTNLTDSVQFRSMYPLALKLTFPFSKIRSRWAASGFWATLREAKITYM